MFIVADLVSLIDTSIYLLTNDQLYIMCYAKPDEILKFVYNRDFNR